MIELHVTLDHECMHHVLMLEEVYLPKIAICTPLDTTNDGAREGGDLRQRNKAPVFFVGDS